MFAALNRIASLPITKDDEFNRNNLALATRTAVKALSCISGTRTSQSPEKPIKPSE